MAFPPKKLGRLLDDFGDADVEQQANVFFYHVGVAGTRFQNDLLGDLVDRAHTVHAKMPNRNVEDARKCLEAAGYASDANGMYFSCTLDTFNTDNSLDIAAILVENLKEAGIDVKINSMEYAAWSDKVKDGKNFEFTLLGGQQSPDISAAGERLMTGGSMNFMNYSNSKIDDLFSQGSMETNQEERYKIYKKIQVYLAEDIPQVPLSDYKSKTAIPAYVMGHPWTEPSCIYYSSACWAGTWLDKSQMN